MMIDDEMDSEERFIEVNFFWAKMGLVKVRLADAKSRQREHEKQSIHLGLYCYVLNQDARRILVMN